MLRDANNRTKGQTLRISMAHELRIFAAVDFIIWLHFLMQLWMHVTLCLGSPEKLVVLRGWKVPIDQVFIIIMPSKILKLCVYARIWSNSWPELGVLHGSSTPNYRSIVVPYILPLDWGDGGALGPFFPCNARTGMLSRGKVGGCFPAPVAINVCI